MIAISRNLGFAGLALLGWAGMAHAAPVTTDFAGSPDAILGNSAVFDLGGGLSVTVSAHTHDGGNSGDAPFTLSDAEIAQVSQGLGVLAAPVDTNIGIDGFGPDELLRFTFSKTVTLVSVVFQDVAMFFQDVESNDEFDMAVDDMDVDVSALLGTDDIGALPNGGFGSDSNLADFTGAGLIGTVFDFYTTEADDDYLIRALTVDVADDAADVPAPGALMLLGFGLAGLSLARRRRAETPADSRQAGV